MLDSVAETFQPNGRGVFDDFPREDVWIGHVIDIFESLTSAPKDVEACLVVGEKPACPHFSLQPFSPVLGVMVVEFVVLNGVDEAKG